MIVFIIPRDRLFRETCIPESWDHFGKADDLLDAVGDQVSQVGQHRKAGSLLLAGVRATALFVVHQQQIVEIHFCVNGFCRHKDKKNDLFAVL